MVHHDDDGGGDGDDDHYDDEDRKLVPQHMISCAVYYAEVAKHHNQNIHYQLFYMIQKLCFQRKICFGHFYPRSCFQM